MQVPRILPKNTLYEAPEPEMELQVLAGSKGYGRIKLSVARSISQNAETSLQSQIDAEVAARKAADSSEATARANADTQEATARASADAQEATARVAADKALSDRITALETKIVPFTATLVLPAGISLLVGKSTRTVAITGLKKNDNLVVTPNAALPANISMGEAYCLADGVLTVVLLNTAVLNLSITAQQSFPLGVIALRP